MWLCLGFRALIDGIHPSLGVDKKPFRAGTFAAEVAGTPVCDGWYRGCIWAMPMDAGWACNEPDVEHFNASSCCTWCPADREAFNVRDFSDNARWRRFLYSPAFARPVSDHPVWTSGLGTSRSSYMGIGCTLAMGECCCICTGLCLRICYRLVRLSAAVHRLIIAINCGPLCKQRILRPTRPNAFTT